MNIGIIVIAFLTTTCVFFFSLYLAKKKEIKIRDLEIQTLKASLIVKEQELEVIKNVQIKILENKKKNAPKTVQSCDAGDSDSRLERLNRVSDNSQS